MNTRQVVVSAAEMAAIEEQIFEAGMPVAALMEKVAGLITEDVVSKYPLSQVRSVGILIGPGHNGGDALVVARELYFRGYEVRVCRLLKKAKDLTASHAQYVESLGISIGEDIGILESCHLIIDGLFGFGLTRPLEGKLAAAVNKLNSWLQPVVSIDLPSGLHTDTGAVLGTAVRATHTLCLGLWKRAFFQEQALEYLGEAELVDFGIVPQYLKNVLGEKPQLKRLTGELATDYLPLPRSPVTHKYKQGHLLLICGSQRFGGGSILTALGARASGVGMLSVAVPASLKPLLLSQLPEALVIACTETETGAIAELPEQLQDLGPYNVLAAGPGLTLEPTSTLVRLLEAETPLILDADGLNILAEQGMVKGLKHRKEVTVLTPHLGEFKRLFPNLAEKVAEDRLEATREAARQSGAIVLLKGSRSAIATPEGSLWLIPESTPALARGGSGDVLTGLMAGLLAQGGATEELVATAAWWHSQAGILAAKERSELGVDAYTLSQYLCRVAVIFGGRQ